MVINILYLDNAPELYAQANQEENPDAATLKKLGVDVPDTEKAPLMGRYRSQPTPIDPSSILSMNALDKAKTRMTIRMKDGSTRLAIYDAQIMELFTHYVVGKWASVAAPVYKLATGNEWAGAVVYMMNGKNYPEFHEERELMEP